MRSTALKALRFLPILVAADRLVYRGLTAVYERSGSNAVAQVTVAQSDVLFLGCSPTPAA